MNIPQQINSIGRLDENIGIKHFKLFFRFIKHNRIILTMELEKISNLLNEAIDSRSVTRKWNNVNGYQNPHYIVGNEIIYSAEVLKSNLCDFNDA